MEQLLCHLVGDYVLQSHWMATEKTKRSLAAFIHVFLYGLPFILLVDNVLQLHVIIITHYFIDRYRLARHVGWIKNFLAPSNQRAPWNECSKTGYPSSVPDWMSVWLMIIVDQTLHLTINYVTLRYL